MYVGSFPMSMKELEDFYKERKGSKDSVIFAVCDKKSGKHIGNVSLYSINWVNKTSRIGCMIGDKSYWCRGIGTEITSLMVDYAFDILNLNKVSSGVIKENKGSVGKNKNNGFELEGIAREEVYRRGRYYDVTLMAITRKDWKKRA